MKKYIRNTFLVSASLLVLIILILGLTIAFMQTAPGQRLLENTLNKALVLDKGRVAITGISGRIPFNLEIENISLEDEEGEWLNITGARLWWSFSRLLAREIHIFELGAETIELSRLPDVVATDDEIPDPPKKIEWTWPLPLLTVEQFYLSSVLVSDQVLDEYIELGVEGSLSADKQGFSLTDLRVDRLDKPSSMVSLSAHLTRDPHYLDLNLSVLDSDVLKSLIPLEDWPASTSLELRGSGPMDSWQGELILEGLDMFSTVLDLEIVHDEFYFLSAGGEVFVSPLLLPARGLDFTQDPLEFFLKIGLDKAEQVVLENLNISSPRLDLKAYALLDPDQMSVSGNADLNIPDPNLLLMDSGFKSEDPLQVNIDFEGPVNALSVSPRVLTGAVSGHGLSMNRASLSADFKLFPSTGTIYSTTGGLELTDFNIQQYTNLPGDLFFEFDLEHFQENFLNLKKLDLEAHELSVGLAGKFNLGTLEFEADLNLNALEIQQFIPGLDRDAFFSSALAAAVKGGGNIREFQFFADADVKLSGFQTDDEVLGTLTGDSPKLSASLTFGEDLILRVSRARLDAREFIFAGAGNMGFKDMEMDYSGQLVMESLAGLAEALDTEFSGELSIDLAAQGEITAPDLLAQVLVADFRYAEIDPTRLQAELRALIRQGGPAGNIEMFMTQAEKRIDMETGFSFRDNRLEISDFSAWGHGVDVAGELDFDLENRLALGHFLGTVPDLSSLGEFIDLEISGNLEWELYLQTPQHHQNISYSLSGQDFGLADITISRLQASGRMEDAFSKGFVQTDISMSGIRAGNAEIYDFSADLQGTLDRIEFSATTEGKFLHPLDLSVRGSYAFEELEHLLELSDLRGTYAQEHFHLDSSSVLVYSPDKTSLSPFNLVLESGILSAQAELSQEQVYASVELAGLELGKIPVRQLDHVLGVLNFNLMLTGSPAYPVINADINIDGFAPAAEHLEFPQPLDFMARISLEQGQATIDASLLEDQTELAGLGFSLPVSFSIEPFETVLPDPVPLSGEFRSSLDLEALAMILLPPDQLLTGTVNSSFVIAGTLDQPNFQGTIEVEGGSYEHLDAGIYIADLELRAVADQTRIIITWISATDGLDGQVSGSGNIELTGNMNWNLELDIMDMRFINHNLAVVYVDRGQLEISGDTSQAEVSGRIVFESVNARLPEQAPPGVVDLDVTEINLPPTRETVERPRPGEAYPVLLDLELVFPARVYVRGRGLDSEWQGQLNISGEATSPSVRGNLNVVRGRLDILDRRFDLARESNINLDGTHPPEPNVDIRAAYSQRDMTINARVYGPALAPEIELSSDPPMPQDEILAWVLFGRDLSNISPFQAIALANAARNLATGRTGTDMMGQVRDLIGVDDLEITRDPEEGYTQFGLGKYVHERVYIEVKKGTAPGTDAVQVEVELTPRISMESKVGSDRESGIGIFWKYDY